MGKIFLGAQAELKVVALSKAIAAITAAEKVESHEGQTRKPRRTDMKKIFAITMVAATVAACSDDAQVASHNMQKAADNFEIMRRVILYNAIRGENVMVTEGRCSVEPKKLRTAVICKIGDGQFIRNFYGASDNTLYFVEQMAPVPVNVYHYRRTFKPQTILPDVDFRGDLQALGKAVTPDTKD